MTDEQAQGARLTGHDDALLREAAHRLVDTVARYGVLTRHRLAILSGADGWRRVSFERALHFAVDYGLLRRVSADLYEIPASESPSGKH